MLPTGPEKTGNDQFWQLNRLQTSPHQSKTVLSAHSPNKDTALCHQRMFYHLLTEADERQVPLLYPTPLKQHSCGCCRRGLQFDLLTVPCKYRSATLWSSNQCHVLWAQLPWIWHMAECCRAAFSLPVATFWWWTPSLPQRSAAFPLKSTLLPVTACNSGCLSASWQFKSKSMNHIMYPVL